MGHTRSSKKYLIVRHKQGKRHITQCKGAAKGYYQPSDKFTQIHHIVCLSSMTDATIAKLVKDKGKMEFIRECLKLTKWNINDADNTVGLPLKRAFVQKSQDSALWNGWPCHQVEHNPLYTKAVSKQLYDIVWVEVLKARKKCTECETRCNINAKSVATELGNQSTHWYDFLDTRGKEHGGTATCWEDRLKKGMKNIWYFPFSMALTPAPRDPPPDWADVGGTLKRYLSKVMFSLV